MIKSGITRRIDELGRIVIPKEIRKNLKIRDSDEIEINVDNNCIILNKYDGVKVDTVISMLVFSLGKFLRHNVLFTSKDKVIESFSISNHQYDNMELNNQVIDYIENRKMIMNEGRIKLFNNEEELSYIICPLIINGDVLGSLIVFDNNLSMDCHNIILFCQQFLENYLE